MPDSPELAPPRPSPNSNTVGNSHCQTTRPSSSRVSPAKPNPNLLQDAGGSILLRQRKRKNPGPGLRVLHDLDQMTPHFGGKTTTLKSWKSKIRDLDFSVLRRRTKCARADYRVVSRTRYPIHGGYDLAGSYSPAVLWQTSLAASLSGPTGSIGSPFFPISTKDRRESFKAESQIRGRESRSRLLVWEN